MVRPFRQIVMTEHPAWERFFARRCPHLAGMIAYFGILSLIPAAFVFLATLQWVGVLGNVQDWLVEQFQFLLPEDAVDVLVETIDYAEANYRSVGLVGLFGLVWGTSNFFSCIESGLNIIHGVNNRYFFKQKGLVIVLMTAALGVMTFGMFSVVVARPVIDRFQNVGDELLDVLHVNITSFGVSVVVSLIFAFFFFLSCYRFLPNVDIHTRECWRGALIAAISFEISIHILQDYLARQRGSIVFEFFAGTFILLIWFYVMAFVLLAGGTYNWWRMEKRRRAEQDGEEFAGAGVA
jgi:membrane protein